MIWLEKRNKSVFSKQLETELSGLYPGINIKKKIREYYQQKIVAALKLGAVGILIVLLFICNQMMNGDLEEKRYLERKSVGGGEKEVALDAVIGDEIVENVMIIVGEQELSTEEKGVLFKEVEEKLPEIIRDKNESLDYVNLPLNLITEWEGTDISIYWTSSNYGVIQEDGSFGTDDIPKTGIEVVLTALISGKDMQSEQEIRVKVFPEKKSEQESLKAALTEFVMKKERDSRTEEYMELPDMFQGEAISWKEKKGETLPVIAIFPFVVVIAAIWGKDQDIHKKYKERNRQLLLEYSEFVSKMQLLIGSGMSTRNAFIRLSVDYQKRRAVGGKKRFVYEEVMMTVRKLENGMSEEEAYDYFSKRCNQACYKKLVSIIIQNQKKGSEGLKESLSIETKNAFEERKQEARRFGEEAGTKLLIPMMMMMGVVLMIIVIPAYFSFGGI